MALARSRKIESPDVIVMAVHLLRWKADAGSEDTDGQFIANLGMPGTSEKGAHF